VQDTVTAAAEAGQAVQSASASQGAPAPATLAPTGGAGGKSVAASPNTKPEAGPGAASGTAAGKVATTGGAKTRTLATFEGDLNCTRLVASYEASSNLAELSQLATAASANLVSGLADDMVAGRGTKASTAGTHRIPLELREKALRMNWLPMAAEVKYGDLVLDKMKSDVMPRDGKIGRQLYPKGEVLLKQVLTGVTEAHAYTFKLHVMDVSTEGAAALAGGHLLIDAPLLQLATLYPKAQYALAHEVAHVLQRHETRAAQARILDVLSLGGTAVDMVHQIRTLQSDPLPLLRLAAAGQNQFMQHFGDQELNADGCAVRVLQRALSSPPQLSTVVNSYARHLLATPGAAAEEAVRNSDGSTMAPRRGSATLAEKASEASSLMNTVNTPIQRHPAPAARAKNLVRALAEMAPSGAAPGTKTGAAKANEKVLVVPVTR
jgi:Peptidase family M48